MFTQKMSKELFNTLQIRNNLNNRQKKYQMIVKF